MVTKSVRRSLVMIVSLLLFVGAIAFGHGQQQATSSSSAASAPAMKVQFHKDASGFVEPVWPKYTKQVSITFWTWIKNSKSIAKEFMKAYPNIHVTVKNVGSGQAEYTKLTTAIRAGSGAPDVVQVELQFVPQFVNTGGLLNIAKYASGYKSLWPEWVWGQVSLNGKLYAIPQDIGPMGFIYRKELYQKYGLSVPKTWAQFAQEAKQLHSANPSKYLTFFSVNDGGWMTGLLWQGGVYPFKDTPNGWKINFTSSAAKRVVSYWANLVKAGDVQVANDFQPTWIHNLAAGSYGTVLGAAWSPTYEIEPYMKKGTSQQWRVALMPQWSVGQKVDSNWGGSTDAVTKQTKHPEAAALFAAWINANKKALNIETTDIGKGGSGLFTSDVYTPKVGKFNAANAFLGGQHANSVFTKMVPWVDKKFQWSPWSSYVYNEMTVEFTKLFAGKLTVDQTLQNLQTKVTSFARAQGFQVAQ